VLLLSAFICFYTLKHYKASNTIIQRGQFSFIGNNPNEKSMPGSQSFPQGHDAVNPYSNNQGQMNQANANRGMKSQNDGTQSAYENQNKQSDQNANDNSNNNKRGNNKNKQSGQLGQFGGNMQRGGEDAKYFQAISIYGGVFIILSCLIYYLFKRKKLEIDLKEEKLLVFTLLAVGFLLRIAASTLMQGYSGDINLFRNWAETAAKGFANFYSSARQADYPPLYIYVLGLIGKIASVSSINPYYILLLKIPSILADVITAYFIYKLGKKYLNSVISILLGAFYIFNPAIFIDSTFWGQVDSFFTLLIVIALYLLAEKKYVLSSGMFAVAILMKPQGIIFLPILFIELVRQKKLKNFIYAGVSALITVLIIIIPFSLNTQNPLWIINLYIKTISEYQYASVNAFNFFGLIGGNYKDYNNELFLMSYHTIGMIFIIITTLIGWFIYIKGNDRKYISAIALLQIAGVFTFSVGMHERYLFPAVAIAILALIYLKDRRFLILAIGFSITNYINISTILFRTNNSIFNYCLEVTSVLNILLVAYLLKILFDNAVRKFSLRLEKEESEVL
jgi:Gpi18-like mannosyltransferase